MLYKIIYDNTERFSNGLEDGREIHVDADIREDDTGDTAGIIMQMLLDLVDIAYNTDTSDTDGTDIWITDADGERQTILKDIKIASVDGEELEYYRGRYI